MSYLQEALLKKEEELSRIISQLEGSLTDAPEGHLRISHSGKSPQYYYRSRETDGSYKTGKYIRKDNQKLAYKLAQRDYEKKLLTAAKKQLSSVLHLQSVYHADELTNIYDSLNPHRREITVPEIVSDKMFMEQWLNLQYHGKGFTEGSVEIYTEKGERVRSKSEKIIADMLYRNGLEYRYEYPLTLQRLGTIYPDFMILDLKKRQEIYWEHLGMMDNPEYSERALYKLNCYMGDGICLGDRLLVSYETSKRPLDTTVIENMIKVNFRS